MALDTLLDKLQTEDHLAPSDVASLSGIGGTDRERFLETWRSLSIARRRSVIDWLAELSEDSAEYDFTPVFMAGIFDDDVQVRGESIKGLWEYEGDDFVPVLMRLLADPEALVRGEAALGLGRYLLRAELSDRSDERVAEMESGLRNVLHDSSELPEVRGRALEALGVRTHEWVRDEIDDAYGGGDRRMRISAVHAMGRSADPEWLPIILEEMQSDDGEMRFEAATAAGMIAEEDVVPELAALAYDEDAEVQEAAISALGQIGGPAARSALHSVASESRDERVLEAVSDALSEADFMEDPLSVQAFIEQSLSEEQDEEDDE
jgi:HEAT repeat protein